MINFNVRLVVTMLYILLLQSLYPNNIPYIPIIIGAIILDLIDCDMTKIVYKFSCNTHKYQKYDKIVDSITYLIIIIIFSHNLPPIYRNILIFAWFWRMIGVVSFYYHENYDYMVQFPDLFKELLLLYYLDSLNIVSVDIYGISVVVILKTIYEYLHHKTKIHINKKII